MSAPNQWAAGQPVRVLAGLSKDRTGKIVRCVDWKFGQEPVWSVEMDSGLPRRSAIRQSYLAEEEPS